MGVAQTELKMRCLLCLVLITILFFVPKTYIYAESSYVLPYPSSMPGSFAYKFHLVYENFSKYWYFGEFGQFDYNLKMADKYLVEAKTLFEYKQYLLGYKALRKSDFYFPKILLSLIKAEKNNKNITQKRIILKKAALKHTETLQRMITDTPNTFNWQPEKSLPTILNLKKALNNSVILRKDSL